MQRPSLLLLAFMLAPVLTAPALAQTSSGPAPQNPPASTSGSPGADSQGDFDAGYDPITWVRNQGTTTKYEKGWHAGASYRIRRIISVIAEASGDYRSVSGNTASIYTYAGGARFQSGRKDVRIKPFLQLLFGGGQDNGDGSSGKTNHYPMLSPGGGVDIGVSSAAAIRLRLDFPLLMTFGDPLTGQVSAGHTLKCTRLSIGLSFPFGTR
jgi:hypothetical protein